MKFRVIQRPGVSIKKSIAIRTVSICAAFIFVGIIMLIMKHNPFKVYISIIQGAFGNIYRIKEVIRSSIPLIITSLGITVAFKMKFWNIGGEGQIIMGACAASYFALFHGDLPSYILIPIMFAAAFVGGGLFALLPAFFKSFFGTNETLFTLMLNYIGIKLVTYLQYSLWKDPKASGFPKIARFSESAFLPNLLGMHIGWLIALILCVIIYIFLKKSKMGYEIAVLGESENTARYAGMNVKKITMLAILISGGLCGVAGVVQVAGVEHTLSVQTSGGIGYTAIITAWLSGLNPIILIIVSMLFASLTQGASYIQIALEIPQAAAQMIQGIILFFVLGSEFFIKYKIVKGRDQ